ncbi:MAG: hypothetical protein A3D89_05150 [Planctomycetes bacterium RIFCSPHIGHO2_02_FULL_52_58]|nr:MAG: hypothetical protein A3D89_05150 [Planctomycetes bacterium RIFCSPHIGHO2_02_FULL_52_58]
MSQGREQGEIEPVHFAEYYIERLLKKSNAFINFSPSLEGRGKGEGNVVVGARCPPEADAPTRQFTITPTLPSPIKGEGCPPQSA